MSGENTFKVASWNVNSINARMERLVPFLNQYLPDVLCLQEIKCREEQFPGPALQAMGYHCSVFGQKSYNGVAVLSRRRPQKVLSSFHDSEEDPNARFLSVQIGDLTVLCAYIPNGQEVGAEAYFYKLKWMERLRKYLDKHHSANDRLLLSGDFNVAPEDRDVHDPELWRGKILFSDPERAALENVKAFPLEDTFRLHHQEEGHYSWWDYRALGFQKNHGLRIDFILCSPPLAKTCVRAYIDREYRKGEKPSDHAPVLAEFSADATG